MIPVLSRWTSGFVSPLSLVLLGWGLCVILGFPNYSQAQSQGSASVQDPEEAVSLEEAALQALQHNLDIKISRQTREVRLTDILFEQAKFDPTLDLSARYDRTLTPLNRPILGFSNSVLTQPDTFDQNQTQWGIGFKQKILTGADYDLSFTPQRTSVAGQTGFLFNPSYDSNVTLNFSQPLLRDFGPDINKTQIRIAQNNAKVEGHIFSAQVLTVIAQVEQSYWELVFAREDLTVAQTALKAAMALESSNRAKAKAGVMAVVDVLQAEAAVASRIEGILVAEKNIRDQEDQLRKLLTPTETALRTTIRLTPTTQPITTLTPISLQETIDQAIARRPEVLQAEQTIESSQLNVKFAKNQLLPGLAFQGTAGLLGLGSDFGDSVSRNVGGDFYTFGGGLVLSYPIGNRSAWSQYTRRQLEARNAQASLQRTRQEVIISIREAVRRVRTDFQRIETTRSARILAQKQLRAEQERLNVGLSTTRLVLDFQRDLAIAQRNELRATIDYNKSLSNLALQRGSTLDRYQFTLE